MTHLRLKTVAALVAMAVLVWTTAMLWSAGNIAAAILAALGVLAAAAYVVSIPLRLTGFIARYVDVIEAGDTTTVIQRSDDPSFNRMADALNRLTRIYGTNCMDLERSKLYYDRILRVMTHEMRNSITPVIALSADMKENAARYTAGELAEAVEVINDQSTSIRNFLDSYYELTHLGEPKPEAIDAAAFLRGIAHAVAPFAEGLGLGHDDVSYIVATGFRFTADRELMSRAVINLLRNAIEAVACRENPSVEVTLSANADGVLVTIADNGPGLDPKVEADLFQPFLTTKRGGAGVGLNLSRQIARLHGGDLSLKSLPGRGVTAFLTIPYHSE